MTGFHHKFNRTCSSGGVLDATDLHYYCTIFVSFDFLPDQVVCFAPRPLK